MKYLYINGMIINSNAVRNICFKTGKDIKKINFFLENDKSLLTVSYPTGARSSDLVHGSIRCVNDEELKIEGTYRIDLCAITINGIKYYPSSKNQVISQYIVKDSDSEDSFVTVDDETGEIVSVIRQSDILMSADDYIDMFSDSGLYCELVDPNFKVTNFNSVGFNKERSCTFNNVAAYDNQVLHIDETIIVSGFLDWIEGLYPQYRFRNTPSKVNDYSEELDIDGKECNNVIFYSPKLALENDQYNQRPLSHPDYDTFRMASIPIEFEFLTDDTLTYTKFREEFIMQREFSPYREFEYLDPRGEKWSCSVIWDTLSDNSLDKRGVQVQGGQGLNLHSFKFTCNIVGILCRRYIAYPTILYKILNIHHN